MALVLIAEDGSGVAGANSLISLANSELYYLRVPAAYVHAAKWNLAATTNALKEQVLVMATDLLKTRFNYIGVKKFYTQTLPFPRLNMYDESGFYISDTTVPEAIQFATAELAGHLLVSDKTAEAKTKGIAEMTVDVIKFVFDKYDRPSSFPESVQNYLAYFVASSLAGSGPKLLKRF